MVSKSTAPMLHLGCGPKVAEGWVNVDGSWSAWFANHTTLLRILAKIGIVPARLTRSPYPAGIRIQDLRKPLTFAASNSCNAVYASHVLEHLSYAAAQKLLAEAYRVLRPGCAARIVVPDLKAIVMEYLGQGEIADQSGDVPKLRGADRFSARFINAPTGSEPSSIFYRVYTAYTSLHLHKWMYDAESLISHMQRIGFVDVRERGLFESRIDGIERVEDPDRLLAGNGICVEGIKPNE